MIDTHAHLDFENFDKDREDVIQRFFSRGGKAIVNIGVDLETSRKSIELAEKHENIYAAVGIHPEYFTKGNRVDQGNWGNIFYELKKFAGNKKAVAIGECGLDYYQRSVNSDQRTIDAKSKELQKKGFIEQIKLAQELDLPVIVHCREAWSDLYDIVKSKCQNPNAKQNPKSKGSKKIQNTGYEIPDTKFVLHCYSGEKEDTEKFLELPNVYFSFSGNITYPKPSERAEKLAEAVRMVPLDRLMLDSDSPFLAPQAMRGKRNEPLYVQYIAEKIAEIKEISGEEVERITDLNAIKFFGI